ncbi:hypothetical protein D915_000434 [Fasciola hepatica]|uniref:Uncharacterized protein n=1 Tax=Fasciola hepatica TaxID=6192 RepID=A0A4E0RY79_FASHE|nr:hypothetical protein D915_000434 [Fasciola hepatica]
MMTEPSNFRQRRSASYSLDSTLIDSTLHMNKHNQINVNAVCPDSTTTVVDRSNSLNQPTTPSVATAATITTYASSRWSRNTPNPIYHLPYSPNRMTPASTPSRRINTQTSLLETAKMLLTESSKLEPICGPLASPREQTGKPINVESMIGGGDAGEKVDHEKVRATLERKRHREAAELQKQISALDATIERLYSRTREKTLYLHKVVNETFRHIQDTITQRSTERRAKQQQKRRVTSELFLRHFRDRQARKRRIRIKLGLRAAKSGRMTGVLPAILTSREVEEGDALRKWQMKEDARDNEEQSMALKFEEETAAKATSRLRWLREVATTQLRHLEEFIRVTQPKNEERASKDVPVDTILFDLRAKHQRLINLLQKYGITTDEENEPTVTAYQLGRERTLMSSTDAPVPATVALRTLWSDLQEDKLTRLQRQAINHFERVIHRESRSPFTRPTASPRARRRKQWKQDATFLSYYGHAITRFGFSYFDFWKVKEIDSEDEEEKQQIKFPCTQHSRKYEGKNWQGNVLHLIPAITIEESDMSTPFSPRSTWLQQPQ